MEKFIYYVIWSKPVQMIFYIVIVYFVVTIVDNKTGFFYLLEINYAFTSYIVTQLHVIPACAGRHNAHTLQIENQ